jgi:hypothetical protein
MQHPLNSGKIQKYSELLDVSEDFIEGIRRFNQFQILFSQFWFKASISSDAPLNDLTFNKKLIQYRTIDKPVADACLKTFCGQLHYLVPEMTFLSLASDKVGLSVKKQLAATIISQPQPLHFPIKQGDHLIPRREGIAT